MGKTYSQNEKVVAIKLAKEIGAAATGERLNINKNTVQTWLSDEKEKQIKANKIAEDAGGVAELVNEIEKLKAKIAEKDQEMEVLQEAIAFFSRHRKK